MIKYLKLIRIQNLLMVPLTMYLLRYGIIEPALTYGYSFALGENMQLQLPFLLFNLLILINMLLGAAGYVINDYFDRKIDSINRPEEVIVGNTVHRRFAIILHFTLNAIAVILSGFLAWHFRKPLILVAYLMIVGIFWLYSTTYKKQFLIGNIIVALGTAMIPLQLAYFELNALIQEYGLAMALQGQSFKVLLYWLASFALFAFLTNLIREIIKDMEDFEGDSSYGCNTIPVILGVKSAKIIISMLSILTIWLLWYFYNSYLNNQISKWYLLFTIAIPLVVVTYFTVTGNSVKRFHYMSQFMKIIMLNGILYSVVTYFLMEYLIKL
ncbi:MAG: geranylgeranylglycerol-phosphate geranylgeranyltransferase [Salinivirgaceae bacterium]